MVSEGGAALAYRLRNLLRWADWPVHMLTQVERRSRRSTRRSTSTSGGRILRPVEERVRRWGLSGDLDGGVSAVAAGTIGLVRWGGGERPAPAC
jgi:hypothetical protein